MHSKKENSKKNYKASIDLGTNTCLLLIAEWDEEHHTLSNIRGDYSTIVRLGEGVERHREFQPEPMARTLHCLKEYIQKLNHFGISPSQVIAVATSQARDAKNSVSFFSQVQKETGIQFRTLSGEEEATFTFRGTLLPEMRPENSCVIDIGGGSTEIISENSAQSVDMGSVRFTEKYLKSNPPTDEEFWACQEAIDQELQKFIPWRKKLTNSSSLVAVAGTATTLAAWYLGLERFDAEKINSVVLTRGDLHRMVEELKWRTVEERKLLPGMEPQRADVILAGALILWRAMELLDFAECRISTRGLRYGVLLASSLLPDFRKREQK